MWFSDPNEVAFTVSSQDADTLRFSFPETVPDPSVPLYGTESGVEWLFEMETPEGHFDFNLPYLFSANPIPDLRVAPGETAAFRIWGLDPCPFCRRSESPADTLSDRLHIRVSDGTQADTALVVLETIRPVSNESGPDASAGALRLYPTPTHDWLTVYAASEAPWEGEATVIDVLGRVGLRFRIRANAEARLDLRSLPSGAYFVHVAAPSGEFLTRRFLVLD